MTDEETKLRCVHCRRYIGAVYGHSLPQGVRIKCDNCRKWTMFSFDGENLIPAIYIPLANS